jgi:predicted RNA-binding protein with PIN domain
MPEEWLIDGYNLLYEIRFKFPKSGLSDRGALFSLLAGFAAAGRRVTAVLDGCADAAELEPYRTKDFEAVFSGKRSADAYIEARLSERAALVRTVVVTRDAALRSMARGYGARVIAPDEFLELVREEKKEGEDAWLRRPQPRIFNRPFDGKLGDKT